MSCLPHVFSVTLLAGPARLPALRAALPVLIVLSPSQEERALALPAPSWSQIRVLPVILRVTGALQPPISARGASPTSTTTQSQRLAPATQQQGWCYLAQGSAYRVLWNAKLADRARANAYPAKTDIRQPEPGAFAPVASWCRPARVSAVTLFARPAQNLPLLAILAKVALRSTR
jgi:hypothetical protein